MQWWHPMLGEAEGGDQIDFSEKLSLSYIFKDKKRDGPHRLGRKGQYRQRKKGLICQEIYETKQGKVEDVKYFSPVLT